MLKKILLTGFFLFALPLAALAQCRWAPYDKSDCQLIGRAWGMAQESGVYQESYCRAVEKTSADTACCCAADTVTLGCCEYTTYTGGPGGVAERHAAIHDNVKCKDFSFAKFFSPYPLYSVGVVNSEPGCVKDTKKCFWVTNAKCDDIGKGWVEVTDSKEADSKCGGTFKKVGAKCCCGPQSGYSVVKPPPVIVVVPGGGVVRSVYETLPNPLGPKDWTIINLPNIIGKVIRALLSIVGAIALLIFVYGGFVWMTAAGNDARVAKGKNILLWATIAIIIIFLSWMLVAFFFQALGV